MSMLAGILVLGVLAKQFLSGWDEVYRAQPGAGDGRCADESG